MSKGNVFLLRSGTKQKVYSHYSYTSSRQCNKARKGNKRHTDHKEEKLPLFSNNIIVNMEISQGVYKKIPKPNR